MSFSLFAVLKGLLIQNEVDRSKQVALQVDASATANTTTTIVAAQTANRTITLPDASDALLTASSTATLTNKTIDADGTGNVISNIDNANIKAAAAIDAAKIADGSVSNAEFQALDGVTSNIQDQIDDKADDSALTAHISDTTTHGTTGDIVGTSDAQVLTNKTIDGDSNTVQDLALSSLKTDLTDASKFLVRDASGIVISSTKAVPTGDVVGTSDAQVITTKDIDGGTASNTSRLTIPKNTKANLDALTRKEGTLVYASDENEVYADDGTTLVALSGGGGGGANTALSNLVSVAVNTDLLPNSNDARNLGSDAFEWGNIYVKQILHSGGGGSEDMYILVSSNGGDIKLSPDVAGGGIIEAGSHVIANINNTYDIGSTSFLWKSLYAVNAKDSSGNNQVDFSNRQLTSGATVKLDWSGTNVSLNTRKLTSVSDPTTAQDAATKAYVDARIYSIQSQPSVGGSGATETLNIPGMSGSDTVIGVFQETAGANNQVMLSAVQSGVNVNVTWAADPGAGAIVRVAIIKV